MIMSGRKSPCAFFLFAYFCNSLRFCDGISLEEMVVKQAGIYEDENKASEFRDVVLVTSGNMAYMQMYRNWEKAAKRFGLKWVFIAMDKHAFDEVGEDKSILADTSSMQEGEQQWGTSGFNSMSCLKKKMVQQIIKRTSYHVVFSDCDNVFLQDPFALGTSLGDNIRDRLYDYVFQMNIADKGSLRTQCPKKKDSMVLGECNEPDEGNTGFYYLANYKKEQIVKLIDDLLTECSQKPNIDDQTNFWNVVRRLPSFIEDKDTQWTSGGFKGRRFCARVNINDPGTLSFCNLDPWQHPTGMIGEELEGEDKKNMATYHANYVIGRALKIERLRKGGAWLLE
eukprot:m.341870 g.341870  ORF g.341870 m.341870 type:complete len:339 (+) comp20611_c0_seq1:54-1070(+)